jgi:hypothetical protein
VIDRMCFPPLCSSLLMAVWHDSAHFFLRFFDLGYGVKWHDPQFESGVAFTDGRTDGSMKWHGLGVYSGLNPRVYNAPLILVTFSA